MSEVNWQNGIHPTAMLLAVRDRVCQRKVLLFNSACCRRVWSRLGPLDRAFVEQIETAIDTPEEVRELEAGLDSERVASLAMAGLSDHTVSDEIASRLTSQTALCLSVVGDRGWGIGLLAFAAAQLVANTEPEGGQRVAQEHEGMEQMRLLRCIFGNPFRSTIFTPEWKTSTVVSLAAAIYGERAFDRLPILADALEEAGCDDASMLDHCRGNSLHVRGCWVIDLVLGKI